MKKLKVTVTGSENNVFIGTELEVEKYLLDLKKNQLGKLSETDAKFYKSETTKRKICHNDNSFDHYDNLVRMNSFDRTKFREMNKGLGMKIVIEAIPDSNEFF